MEEDEPSPNAEINMVDLTITHPITAEIYYITCGQINSHNRRRQESLDIENKLGTKYWPKRFKPSVFSMNVVDAWLAYQGITRTAEIKSNFYNYLSE